MCNTLGFEYKLYLQNEFAFYLIKWRNDYFLNFSSNYRAIPEVIKNFMKDIKLSLVIYERLNDYWAIF